MLWLLLAATVIAAPGAGPVTVRDVTGQSRTLLAPARGRVDLLFFVNRECPISNRYAPEITRICRDYASRGVQCTLVYADRTTTPASVAAHRKEFALAPNATAVIDDGRLTTAIDATVTPEAAIYTSDGRQYRGRIDNLYLDVGRMQRAATVHDVRDALDAIARGTAVRARETEPIGCTIER